jgi:hypothetical protein
VLASAVYPESGSLWAVSGDGKRLVEISKLGTLVRSPLDPSNKCVPSGVGLCDPCMWGVAGRGCRNCAAAPGSDDSALMQRAYRTSCFACPTTSTTTTTAGTNNTKARRLLAAPDDETLLRFAVVGDNSAAIQALWPNASFITVSKHGAPGGLVVHVSITTATPVETMRALKAQLLAHPELQVVLPPHAVLELQKAPASLSETKAAEGLGTGLIVGIVLGSLVFVGVLMALCMCVLHSQHHRHDDDHNAPLDQAPLLQPLQAR